MRLPCGPAVIVSGLILIAMTASAGPPGDPRFDPALRRRLESAAPISRAGTGLTGRLAREKPETTIPLTEYNPDRPVPAFLSFSGGSPDLPGMGFTVLGTVSGAAAVLGSLEAFERLSQWSGLGSARLSRPLEPSLDKGLGAIGGALIRHGVPPAYSGPTGKGAIVAIIDTGVDLLHRDFRRPDGSSRVVAYWDQFAAGRSAEVPVGLVHREAEIQQYIAGNWTNSRGWDRVGHGTHVAGIAAGNGSAAGSGRPYRYVGVAPEADIIAVNTGFDEASVVAALVFVFKEAGRRGQPVAVNLSLGNQYGPHDGTDPFERIVSDLCGPGRQIVVAGGNQGNDGIHAFLNEGQGPDSVSFHVPPYPVQGDLLHLMHLEGWTRVGASFSATIVLPGGRRIGPIRGGPEEHEAPNYVVRTGTGETDFGHFFFIEAFFYGAPRVSGEWMLVIEPDAGKARAPIHFWIPLADFNGGQPPRFVRGFDPRATLSPPANGENVIAVSALVSKTCWVRRGGSGESCFVSDQVEGELASFSSVGPTADGRPKPEVAAPGYGVMSALSSSMTPQVAEAVEISAFLDPDGVHWLNSGTSMSAPFVTGALALAMVGIPDLSPVEAQSRFRAGIPVETSDGTIAGHRLDLNSFASPIAQAGLFEANLGSDRRVSVSWYPIPLRGDPLYRLTRAMNGGAFEIVPAADRRGRGPHVFLDRPLEPGRSVSYRLLAVDSLGVDEILATVNVSGSGSPQVTLRVPAENPGPPPMRFSFFLPPVDRERPYRLRLFDVLGRAVRTLASGVQSDDGMELVAVWDGRSDAGREVPLGLYLVRLEAGSESRTVKVVLRR